MKRLALQLRESKRLFKSFSKRAELVLKLGGTVSFEWPRPSTGWKRPDVVAFFNSHPEFMEVDFDGCAVGLRVQEGCSHQKALESPNHFPKNSRCF